MRAGWTALPALLLVGAAGGPAQAGEDSEPPETAVDDEASHRSAPASQSAPLLPVPVSEAPGARARRGCSPASLDRGPQPVMFHTGLFLTVAGTASMVGGLLFTTAGPGEYCPNCPSSQYTAVGYAALLGGFAAVVTGGALLVVGSKDAESEAEADPSEPEVALGLGSATLRWAF